MALQVNNYRNFNQAQGTFRNIQASIQSRALEACNLEKVRTWIEGPPMKPGNCFAELVQMNAWISKRFRKSNNNRSSLHELVVAK